MHPAFQIPMLSNPKLNRRKVLQLGGMSMLAGAGFGSLLHAGSKTNSGNNKAKSVILVNLFGIIKNAAIVHAARILFN